MSNDRVFLRCSICGEQHLLIKYYPTASYFYDADKSADWIQEHLMHCANAGMFIESFPFEWLIESKDDVY